MKTVIVIPNSTKTFRVQLRDDSTCGFEWLKTWVDGAKTTAYDRAQLLFVIRDAAGNMLASFENIRSFRDSTINYAEEIINEGGTVVWKSDNNGYEREEKVQKTRSWMDETKQIVQAARKR